MKEKKVTLPTPTDEEKKWVLELSKGVSVADLSDRLKKNQNTFAHQLSMLRYKYSCANTTELVAVFLKNNFI
jgi:DNA-binding CsgD family transcriptional regulator